MILLSALSLLMSSPAFAEELYPSPGYFELLPTPDIVGDGATPVLLHMLALTPGGELFSGLNLSPSSKSSKVSDWTEVSPGIYQFKMIPPSITQSKVVAVKIKGKTAEKDKIYLIDIIHIVIRD